MAAREQLQQQHPEWNVWRADGGAWVATRRGRTLTEAEIYAGLCQTLIEDDADRLRSALAEQTEIERAL